MDFWIDTHAHLDAPEFGASALANIALAASKNVAHCVIPAVGAANWGAVRALAHQGGCSYALGIHPLQVPNAQDGDLDALAAQLQAAQGDTRLVAVGEIGLDFFVPALCTDAMRNRQERFYRAQLVLAQRMGLPVILHVRQSADRLLKHLRALRFGHGGIAHAFNGSLAQAQAFVGLGFKLGFGGAVTFPDFIESAKEVVKVLRETDVSIAFDGGNNVGMLALFHAAQATIKKTAAHGIALVSVTDAWMSGRSAYYVEMIAKHRLIAIHTAASPRLVAPPGGMRPVLGTNPIAIAVPSSRGPIVLDMGTSAYMMTEVMIGLLDLDLLVRHDDRPGVRGRQYLFLERRGQLRRLLVERHEGLLVGLGELGARAHETEPVALDQVQAIGRVQ